MGVPVFVGGFQAGEASRPEDLKRIAREYGVRRFIAYAVTSEGEKVLKPENFDELVSQAEKILIIRKEIAAGASPSSNDILAELETRKEELLRELETIMRRIALVKIISQLEQEQIEAQETNENRLEPENTTTEQQEPEQEEYIWTTDNNDEE